MDKEKHETLYAILTLLILIVLTTCMIKLSNRHIKLALEETSKCKIILDHDCIEYGNCKCR